MGDRHATYHATWSHRDAIAASHAVALVVLVPALRRVSADPPPSPASTSCWSGYRPLGQMCVCVIRAVGGTGPQGCPFVEPAPRARVSIPPRAALTRVLYSKSSVYPSPISLEGRADSTPLSCSCTRVCPQV